MNISYAIALAISAIFSATLMIIAWNRRSAAGATGLTLCMAAFFMWSVSYTLRWLVSSQQAQFFWNDMAFWGVVLGPAALLIFALQYTGHGNLVTRRNLVILAIEPILTLILLWTDPLHGLFYGGHRATGAILSGGIGYWINVVYSYAVVLAGAGYLIINIRKTQTLFNRGKWTVLAGMLLPAFAPIPGFLNFSPFPGMDITPLTFILSGIIISFGLFRYRLLDLTPFAHSKLIETMVDGMVVLDEQQHIVNINPAAQNIFHKHNLLGAPIRNVLSPWPELLTALDAKNDASLIIKVENEGTQIFDVTVSKLFHQKNTSTGWLLVFHDISTFKQTEEALVNSENKLRSLFSAMIDVILILDREGRYLEIAPTNPTNLAKDPFHLIGKTVFDLFPADESSLFIDTIQKVLQTGEMVRVDYSMNIDGSLVWFAGNVSPLTKDSVTWVARDITERKQNENKLRASEEIMRYIIKHDPNAIAVYDLNLNYIAASDRYIKDYNITDENIIGKHHYAVFPEMPERWKEIHKRVLNGATEQNDSDSFVRPDGSITYNRWECLPWYKADGEIGGMITYTEVTTERKLAELALKESEQKLRSLFSAMTDVILVFDTEGHYLEVAPTSSSGLYLTPAEILGKNVTEILPDESASIILKAIQETVVSKTITHVEYNLQIENEPRWFVATASPLTDDTVIFVAHDITDQQKTKLALQEKDIQYQELVNNLSEGICIVDLEEYFVFANPTTEMFFGVPQNSMVSHNIQEFVDKETFEFLKLQTNERIAGKSGRYDLNIIRPDGAHRILQVSPRPQLDQAGNCIGTFAVFRDITESRLAQQAIKESETRLKLAQQIAHIGNFELDIKTRRFWGSEETFSIFGLKHNTPYFTFKRVYDLILPEDQPIFSRIIGDLLAGRPTYDEEFRILRRNEIEPRILHGIAQKVTNENGEVIKLSGVVQDITLLKQTEQALEKRMLALTRPLEGSENITFEDLFNIEEIQQLQDEFAKATGVASIITQTNGVPITRISNSCRLCNDIIRNTAKGQKNCFSSDATIGMYHSEGPTIQPCMSGGLWDAGAGISVGGQHIANWLIGQVRDGTQTVEKMREYAHEIGTDEQEMINAFMEVPSMSKKQFEEVAQALFTLANQLSKAAYQNVQQARFISERQRAEDALKSSENKLRSLFKAMTDVIIIYGKDGRYLEIGQTNSGLLYRPQDILLNKTVAEVFQPEIAEFFMAVIRQTLTTKDMVQVDYQLPINGINCWFAANVSPLTEDSVIWVARDITERKKVEDSLHYQSMHDILTGLYNRQYYETEIIRLQNSRQFPISIMALDVDGLKWVNDHRGHSAGDELLQRTAAILKSAFRPEDMVARMGGDEFVVVLPQTDVEAVTLVKNRLEEILKKHNELFSSDQSLGISIGSATGESGVLLTEVFKLADEAMYRIKAGRKRANPKTADG